MPLPRYRYPSDTSDLEWALLERLLPVPACQTPKGGAPEKWSRRRVFDAIRYITDNGAKWRALPADFGIPWRTVFGYFARWAKAGVLRHILAPVEGRLDLAVEPDLLDPVGGGRPRPRRPPAPGERLPQLGALRLTGLQRVPVDARQVPAHPGTGGGQRARREGAALGVRHDQREVGAGRVVVPPLDQLRHVEQPPVGGAVREEPLGVTRHDVRAVGVPRYSEGRTFPALAGPHTGDLSGGVQGDPVAGDEGDCPGLAGDAGHARGTAV
jgi:Transposase and inactivated derivatives